MPEEVAIQNADAPRTVDSLAADLRAAGVRQGMTLLVHSSLSSLGWVAGGAQAVILALTRVVGDFGTLVMPAYSTDNSDPQDWRSPPIPDHWHQTVRDHTPVFDPRQTPTRGLGRIAETFRSWPDVMRSGHPAVSFCALGRYARAVTTQHGLENGLGENSPLARIYDLGGSVLLLGVGHDSNSSLHLAEHRASWPRKRVIDQGAAMRIGDQRLWVRFKDVLLESEDFPRLGAAFDATGGSSIAKVGSATCRLMAQQALVDFGVQWIGKHRGR
ncbi:MAG: AAC(3) family N-acetyltransferase [Planctomycetes bacterium]|nr:AAC(3) family N-acetyltransferase [Planctomycetota bacterium]